MLAVTHFGGHLVARTREGPHGFLVEVAVPPAARAGHRLPGQYCELQVGDASGFFALTRAPGGEGPFAFYVRDNGGASGALVTAPLGTNVTVSAPRGQGFDVAAALAHGGPVHVLASGGGYSGVRSALLALVGAGCRPSIYLGFRHRDDVIFREDLDWLRAVACPLEVCLSQPDEDWSGARGHVQEALARDAPDLRDGWVIACGQPEMQADTARRCAALGLPEHRFLTNY